MNTLPTLTPGDITLWIAFFIALIIAWRWPPKE